MLTNFEMLTQPELVVGTIGALIVGALIIIMVTKKNKK